MFWFRVAFAQLMRRRLRTAILVLALALAWAVLLFFRGLADEGYDQLANLLVRTQSGHVVVMAKGYGADPRPSAVIADTTPVLAELSGEVDRYEERLFFTGILKSAGQVVYFHRGIAAPWPSTFYHGDLLSKRRAGGFPFSGEQVVLGSLLADTLGIEPGDRVVLQLSGPYGPVEKSVPVAAILETGDPAVDRGSVYLPLPVARAWFGLPHGAHQIALFSTPAGADALARRIRANLKGINPSDASAGVEVLTWRQNLPMAAQFIDYHSSSVWLFQFIIFFIITISLVDAFFMSMLERRREHGILRAVGMRRGTLVRLVATESLLLGLIAGALGLALGSLAILYGATVGIDPSWFTGESGIEVAGGVFSGRIHARFPVSTALWSGAALLALTVASTLIPAFLASRVPPVVALRKR
ncbi:FtsX-like permease family protein [Myxococcota bacterium]|nr:FtsX-like permease family protein [Myxococcota bacterium]MBU1410547.1 FtsX-like permease family protein [Myxococcota bacterium]MBU1509184.1 FtsX-like permease family protein [Myxococcota bacterium]